MAAEISRSASRDWTSYRSFNEAAANGRGNPAQHVPGGVASLGALQ